MNSKSLTTAALAAFASASLLLNARADITTGLVGYWSLATGPGNSTVTDLSGNGNAGTLKNYADQTYNNMWTAPGDPTNGWPYALMFTNSLVGFGTNTYVNVPDSASVDSMTTAKQWTLSAWVNCSVPGGSEPANAGIIAKGVSGAEAFALYMSGGHFTTVFRNSANSGNETVSGTTTPAANTWYHVVATVLEPLGTATAEAIIYVNGVRDSGPNNNTYTSVYSSTLPVTIGCRTTSGGAVTLQFLGAIDEVRIYKRALSASDVVQLYQNKAYSLFNQGIGYWNGLAGSAGNATLDTTSLNFTTNLYTTPVGTAANLASLLTVEHAASLSPACFFADSYFSSQIQVPVQNTNLTIASGGVAVGNANGAGTVTFLNVGTTYLLNSTDTNGLKDGANSSSLAQSGAGTVILTGTNTFSGGATISSGTLQVGNGGPSGSPLGSGTVTDNGALVFYGNDSPTFNTTIAGAGTVAQKGSGTLTLTGANTYTGNTAINGGTLNVSAMPDSGTSAIGYGPVTLSGGTLAYTGTGDTTARTITGAAGAGSTINVPANVTLTLNGVVNGTSPGTILNVTGGGTVILASTTASSYFGMNITGSTVILDKPNQAIGYATTVNSGGTLQLETNPNQIYSGSTTPLTVNNGGVFDLNGQGNTLYSLSLAGAGSGSGALINSASGSEPTLTVPITLAANTTIGGPGSIILPDPILGSGMSLTYAGTGTLILAGTNTYTGGTFINSGTLDVNATGFILGNVTVNGTGTLELDNNTALSSVATLTLPASPAAPVVNLTVSGTQTIGVLIIGSTVMPAGTYGYNATNPNNAFQGAGVLNVTGQPYWDAGSPPLGAAPGSGGNGSWDTTTTNWFTGSADTAWPTDALALFAGSPGRVTLNASVNADALTFTTAGYTVTSAGGSVLTLDGSNPTITVPAGAPTTIGCILAESGSSPLAVNGPGTLTLSGANTYTNGITINSGATLSVNTIADSGTSALGLGAGPVTLGTVTGTGANLDFTGPSGLTASTVTLNGTTTSTLNVPSGDRLELDGQVKVGTDSAAPALAFSGGGTLILGGVSNDNSGLTLAINAGMVLITKSTGTNAHGLGGGTSSVGAGSVGNSAELQLAGPGGYDLYTGCKLTVNSPDGVLDLNSQSDSMSTLTLSGAGPAGTGALINSTTYSNSTLTCAGSGVVLAGNTTIGGPGNIALASVVSGGYALTYAGSGTLALSAANTYSGGTIININGTVLLTNSASAAGTGAITDNGTLGVGIVGNNIILPNAISGPGIVNMIQTTGDNLQLGGSMSGFTGTLNCLTSPGGNAKCQILTTAVGLTSAATVNIDAGGTLYVSNPGVTIPCPVNIYGLGNNEIYGALRIENGALISGPVTLYGNTTMGNGQSGASLLATISGPISAATNGPWGITFTAEPGTIVLSGTNTYTGSTTISNTSGNQLVIGGAGQLGSGNYAAAISNYAAFNYASSAPQTLSGPISGTGTLIQSGPGVLTLSGTNTYAGGTLITNGATLIIDDGQGSGSLGGGSYAGAITNYGTFIYASSTNQTLSGAISGTGTLIQRGPGTLTLSGANSYTGATVISNGTTLALGGGGSIYTTPSLSLAEGATLDVSAYTAYSLLSSITLRASGAGTTVGSTAATIKGAASIGASVTLAGPLALTFTPAAFSGDATHPALYVSQISAGVLNLSSSAITISNAAATPLGAGTYSLVQVAPGGTINLGAPTVTVYGLASHTTNSLSVSGGSLNLVVGSTGVPVPAINSVTLSGGSLIFSGNNGSDSGNYYVLTSTNVALPLSNWTTIATGAFSPTGTFSVTNAVGVNPSQFFIIQIP